MVNTNFEKSIQLIVIPLVVNADPKVKVGFVPVAASEVPETKVEQKRKADEELSLPIKASKSNENLSIPRKRLVEEFKTLLLVLALLPLYPHPHISFTKAFAKKT